MKKLLIYLIFTNIILMAIFQMAASETPQHHKVPSPLQETINRAPGYPPLGDEVVSPAEFDKAHGVFLGASEYWIDIQADMALAIAEDDTVFMVVPGQNEANLVATYFSQRGVNMDNVAFIFHQLGDYGVWIRDYGPFYIYEDGDRGIVDFYYGSSQDNTLPISVGQYFGFPVYDNNNVSFQGGNFISDGNGTGFCTDIVYDHNPGYSEAEIRENFATYLGIDSLTIITPMSSDGTGHIDMFCKLLNDTLFIVGEYANPDDGYPGNYHILNQNAQLLSSLQNLDGRNFDVVRIPMPPFVNGGPNGMITYTYTNSLIINDKVLVPIYGFATDIEALDIYSQLMPDHEIIGIDSEDIIEYWGSVHCITKLHYAQNPLIILHEELESLQSGDSPTILFRINPKFENTTASVFYKLASQEIYTEAPAVFENGIWSATLPQITENFDYYIAGTSTSGEAEFSVSLPQNAPENTWAVNVQGTSAIKNDNVSIPDNYGLHNYPNPFNPNTTIQFEIPQDGAHLQGGLHLTLNIYDLSGKLIKNLVDGQVGPGYHSVVWNGKNEDDEDVASGIYFYKIESDEFTQTKQMLLVK